MIKSIYYFITPYRPLPNNLLSGGSRTVFMHLKYLYPECMVLIDGSPQLYPLQCFKTSCPKNSNCMEVLVKRLKYIFDNVTPDAGMLVAYYKWKDDVLKAGVFDSNLSNPRQIKCRESAFEKFKREGEIYRWDPPLDFYMVKPELVIPVERLLSGV